MKRLLLTVLGTVLVAQSLSGASVSRAVTEGLSREKNVRVIALLRTPKDTPREIARSQEMVIRRAGIGKHVGRRWSAIPAFAATIDRAALTRLARDARVLSIESDGEGTFLDVESNALIGATEAQLVGFDGKGVTVAVLDTGVASSHPDLAGVVSEERCYCRDAKGRPCCPNGQAEQAGVGAARDDFGHGTYVANVIASQGNVGPRGVAPGAKIVAIRVAEATGNVTWTSQVLSAVDWILANRPDVRVVNMSFALGALNSRSCDADQPAVADAVRRLRARGIVVVSATGNDRSSGSIRPPACVSGVIAVGAVYDANVASVSSLGCIDNPASVDRVACFSNASSQLDLLAPGAVINGVRVDGATVTSSGTSYAAPHVAGAAALLLQKNRSLTPDEVEALLKTTGRPLVDSRNGVTYPRIDVRAALDATPEQKPRSRPVGR